MRRVENMVPSTVCVAVSVIIGFIIGVETHRAHADGKDAMMAQFQSWAIQEQQDFILAAVSGKPALRREIAEDWCAINKKTQRVCWNARMLHPIRGVK